MHGAVSAQSGFMVKRIRNNKMLRRWNNIRNNVIPKITSCIRFVKDLYVLCFWFFTAVYVLGCGYLLLRNSTEAVQTWADFPAYAVLWIIVHILRFFGANV
jgi:hypothetical protein